MTLIKLRQWLTTSFYVTFHERHEYSHFIILPLYLNGSHVYSFVGGESRTWIVEEVNERRLNDNGKSMSKGDSKIY